MENNPFADERSIRITNPFLVPFKINYDVGDTIIYDDSILYKVIELYPYIRKIKEKLDLIQKMPEFVNFG